MMNPFACEPLIRLPSSFEVVVIVLAIGVFSALEIFILFTIGGRPASYHLTRLARQVGFQCVLACIRGDARMLALALFLAWMIGRNFPWKRWKNAIGSKFSGLTEVMRASFQRQQSEALG